MLSSDRFTVSGKAATLALATLLLAPGALAILQSERHAAQIAPPLMDAIRASPSATIDALVSFDRVLLPEDVDALRQAGLDVPRVFPAFRVAYVVGAGDAVLAAASLPHVARLSDNARLEQHLATATVATRARELWDGKSTSTTPFKVNGVPVDGRGVGVAVIDSDIDATHPDLEPAVVMNKKWICSTLVLKEGGSGYQKCYGDWAIPGIVSGTFDNTCNDAAWKDLPNTDTTSGHGTHVAGIVAGRGVASDGRFMGAAPGAKLYGLGAGEGLNILWALESFNWVKCNHATVDPPIRVVTNSWGTNAAYSATDPIILASDALVADGLVVVFSAGNAGGAGAANNVNRYARNPTQGVIGVANYDDFENATRDGALDPQTSTCLATTPSSTSYYCPDVAAPGVAIVSTIAKTGAAVPTVSGGPELAYLPYYGYATGTSMAAPHVAGVVALLLQANTLLTPALVEEILEDTAYPFSTPGGYAINDVNNTGTTLNYGAGHGLVNVTGAMMDPRVLGVASAGSALPQISQAPHVYFPNVDGQVVAGLQWTEKAGVAVQLSERALVSGNTTRWPISTTTPCRFQVFSPPGTVVATLPCNAGGNMSLDGANLRMDATYAFPSAGVYTVEPQISYGGVYKAFDSFVVRAL